MKRPCLALLASVLLVSPPLAAQVPATWSSRGVGAGGAFYSPSISPTNSSEFYVASDMSGLYHTTDFGDDYATIDARQVQAGHDSAVRFTISASIMYTVTYTGGNNALPTKTTDGGATWQVLPGNPIPDDDVYSLWVDPNNPSRVVLAGYSDVYFSSNGGTSFTSIPAAIDAGNGVLVCGAFFDGNNIYLGTNIGLLVSTNGGTSFTNAGLPGIPAGELMQSFAGAKQGGTVRFFCLTAAASYPGFDLGSDYYGNFRNIYSLDNGAGTWVARSMGIDASQNFLQVLAMAGNDISTVYAGGGGTAGVPEIFKTSDAGATWTNTFHTTNNQNIITGWSGTGGDRGWGYGEVVFGLAVAPTDSAKVLFTDYGFVHRTINGALTWQQAYVNTADQHNAGTTAIAGGTYHSIGLENTSVWQVIWPDAQHLFAGFSDIKGIRSSDRGVTWTLGNTGDDANTMYRIVQHPTTHALYAATSDIHDMYQSTRLADSPLNNADANGKVITSTNSGAAWSVIHNFGHPVFWLALDPNNPNRMYASVIHSTAGGIFVTNDLQDGAASTWTKLSNPPRTEGHPATVIVLNDGKVLCTYSGHRTTAFTASSGVFLYDPVTTFWTDLSDPGMDYWTKDVVLDPADANQNTWYVGVFSGWGGPPNGLGGLYRTTDRGAHWTRVNALDRVTSVTFDPAHAGAAYLTTETDGLWHTNNLRAASPVFAHVDDYPFRQPERVFFNPSQPGEVWVSSFGHALMTGSVAAPKLSADFNSDGMSDILWENTSTGDRALWYLNGTSIGSFDYLAGIPTEWAIVGTADFDGDGQTDIAWEDTATGDRTAWMMNGKTILSFGYFAQVDPIWHLAALGDLNGDGQIDLLWENTSTGDRAVWFMNGTTVATFGYLAGIPTDWKIVGTGDFDGDGQTDIVWENTTTGDRTLWLMNGTTIASFGYIAQIDPAWHIAAVADYNGDGKPDLLWENRTTGDRAFWLMNGTAIGSMPYLALVDPVWHIAP
ncbi:MAG TPA: FG-GAP-like repeat-containing protein [Candidatus Didemnitutus sp.]|jgi:hypothetical protein